MQYRLSTIFLVFFVVATSLASFGQIGLVVAGIVLGLAFLVSLTGRHKFTLVELLVILAIIFTLIGLLLPSVQTSGHCRVPSRCSYNMKQIGMALHNYQDSHGHFPSIITRNKDGKPLHGWLVDVLPDMGYDHVYRAIDPDEPWSSQRNAVLQGLRIEEFMCPAVPRAKDDFSTNYFAIVGPGTIWREGEVVSLFEIRNPSLVVVAVECAVSDKHWAEPCSLTVEEALERMKTGKGMRISTVHPFGVSVLFANGSTRWISYRMPIRLWKKLLMGEITDLDELNNWDTKPDDPIPVNLWINEPPAAPPKPGMWPFLFSILVWLVSVVMLFRRAWIHRKEIPSASS
jgi:type II secretory pathway pseudopilin PulG